MSSFLASSLKGMDRGSNSAQDALALQTQLAANGATAPSSRNMTVRYRPPPLNGEECAARYWAFDLPVGCTAQDLRRIIATTLRVPEDFFQQVTNTSAGNVPVLTDADVARLQVDTLLEVNAGTLGTQTPPPVRAPPVPKPRNPPAENHASPSSQDRLMSVKEMLAVRDEFNNPLQGDTRTIVDQYSKMPFSNDQGGAGADDRAVVRDEDSGELFMEHDTGDDGEIGLRRAESLKRDVGSNWVRGDQLRPTTPRGDQPRQTPTPTAPPSGPTSPRKPVLVAARPSPNIKPTRAVVKVAPGRPQHAWNEARDAHVSKLRPAETRRGTVVIGSANSGPQRSAAPARNDRQPRRGDVLQGSVKASYVSYDQYRPQLLQGSVSESSVGKYGPMLQAKALSDSLRSGSSSEESSRGQPILPSRSESNLGDYGPVLSARAPLRLDPSLRSSHDRQVSASSSQSLRDQVSASSSQSLRDQVSASPSEINPQPRDGATSNSARSEAAATVHPVVGCSSWATALRCDFAANTVCDVCSCPICFGCASRSMFKSVMMITRCKGCHDNGLLPPDA